MSVGGIDAVARDWVRADDIERGEFAASGGFEDLQHVEARRRSGCCTRAKVVLPASWRVAGQHVGQQAHVGCAARVGVVGEQGELCVREREAEVDEALEVGAAQLGADEDRGDSLRRLMASRKCREALRLQPAALRRRRQSSPAR